MAHPYDERGPAGHGPEQQWVLDDGFVSAARAHEESGEVRAARARRIAAADPVPWRAAAPARRRRGLTVRLLRAVALPVLLVGALAVPGPVQDAAVRLGELTGGGQDALVDGGRALPAVPADAGDAPLGRPVVPPPGSGGWAVQPETDGARVDPCRPLHWVMREQGAPPGARELVRTQLAHVSTVTGLRFVDDGSTDEGPSIERDLHQPERYGDRWAPLLVAWSDQREHPPLGEAGEGPDGGEVSALGGAGVVRDGGDFLVAGVVYLDRDELVAPDGSPQPWTATVLLHELGHVLGLDHVEDPDQVMHESSTVARFGDGDLRGLVHAASGPCSTRG